MLSYRKFIFILLIGFLFLPLIQSTVHFVDLKQLSGAYTLSDDTTFTFKGWFSGKYQAHKELYLRDTFGLRNTFIRVNNQIDYSLFKKPHAADVIIGKNGELFGEGYVKAYTGEGYAGKDSIKKRISELVEIQHYLKSHHKLFIVVFAPSKPRLNAEFLPDKDKYNPENNYELYSKLAPEAGLNVIDFDKYFMQIKATSKYPLYPKKGTHWSCFGACIAADSIVSYIESKTHTKMLHTGWKNIIPENASGDELELEYEMNLLVSLKPEILGHPILTYTNDSTASKPSLLFIGDSYFWGLTVHYNFWRPFSELCFYKYFMDVYKSGSPVVSNVTEQDMLNQIKSSDIIILESTETNLANFGWGFIDKTYNIFKGMEIKQEKHEEYMDKINQIIVRIKADKNWLKIVDASARKNNIGLDSALILNAIWVLDQNKN